MDLILHIIRRRNQLLQKRQSLYHQARDSPMVNFCFFICNTRFEYGFFVLLYNHFSSTFLRIGTSPLPLTQTTHTATSVASTSSHTKTTNAIHSIHDITSGCSRTIPISWNNSSLLQVCVCVCLCTLFFHSQHLAFVSML